MNGRPDIEAGGDRPEGALQSRPPPLRRTLAQAIALAGHVTKLPIDAIAQEASKGDGHAAPVLPAWLRGDGYRAAWMGHVSHVGKREILLRLANHDDD